MPSYLITKNTQTEVQNQFQDYFDSTDQQKWIGMMKIASKSNPKKIISKFPNEAPSDLNLWIELYKLIPNSEFSIENEEISSTSIQMQLVNDPDNNSGECVDITLDD
jgi:hypothetical protein